MDSWLIWLVIVIFLILLEIFTINLVSIWFIAGAIVSLLLSFFVDSFYIQFLVFGILGIILMITTRPIIMKFLHPKKVKTNLDRVVGMIGIVTDVIDRNEIGEVKVDGKRWSAIADKKIEIGRKVNILEIDGVKLKVKELEEK